MDTCSLSVFLSLKFTTLDLNTYHHTQFIEKEKKLTRMSQLLQSEAMIFDQAVRF